MDTPGKAISSRAPLAKSSFREMRCVCVYVRARNARSRSRARGGGVVVGGRAGRRDGGTLDEKFPRAPQVFRYRTVATVRVPPAAHVSSDAAAVAYRRSSSRHRAIRRPRIDALGVILSSSSLSAWPLFFHLYEKLSRKCRLKNCNNIIHITLYMPSASEPEMFAKVQWNDRVASAIITITFASRRQYKIIISRTHAMSSTDRVFERRIVSKRRTSANLEDEPEKQCPNGWASVVAAAAAAASSSSSTLRQKAAACKISQRTTFQPHPDSICDWFFKVSKLTHDLYFIDFHYLHVSWYKGFEGINAPTRRLG